MIDKNTLLLIEVAYMRGYSDGWKIADKTRQEMFETFYNEILDKLKPEAAPCTK